MNIIEQAKKIRAAADRRERNEQQIRQAIKAMVKNPLKADLLETMRKIREVLGL